MKLCKVILLQACCISTGNPTNFYSIIKNTGLDESLFEAHSLLPSGSLDNQNADWLIIKITQNLNITMIHLAVSCDEVLIDLPRIA